MTLPLDLTTGGIGAPVHIQMPTTTSNEVRFAPPIDLPFRFQANAGRVLECAVLRPIDLTRTHGVKVTAEDIATMAQDYDPAFEAGALNFDHSWGGPAHGLGTRIWLDGELLWCRMEQLSQEAVDGIASGKWPRRSSEFWMSHPQTGRPYWCGLALLGAATPAVPGLPPAVLLSQQRPIYRLISTGAAVAPSAPRNGEPVKEAAMPNPKKQNAATPPGAEPETPATAPAETPAAVEPSEATETPATEAAPATAAAPAPAAPVTAADLAAERTLLQQEREASRKERLAAKLERAEASVDKLFHRLGTRVPPAAVKAARPLLIALAAQLTPVTLKVNLAGKEQEVGLYDQLVTVLEALPENRFVNNPARASVTPEELASVTAEAGDVNSRAGITPARRAELAAKYPDTYRDPVNVN